MPSFPETLEKQTKSVTGAGSRQSGVIKEFDFLRALAVILLFLHHGGIYNFSLFGFSLKPLSEHVGLFLLGSFVFISGYLSVRSLQRRDLSGFLIAKVSRIYAPYLTALALFMLVMDVDLSSQDFVLHLLGAQIVLAPRLTRPVLTLWFVGMILVYYLIFALLVKIFRRPSHLLVAILLTFGLLSTLRMEAGVIERRFFFYFFVYGVGVLIARGNWLTQATTSRFFLLDKLLPALLGAWLLFPYGRLADAPLSISLLLAINLFLISSILLALSLARLVFREKQLPRPVEWISFASFFAYLFHRPIWTLLLELHKFPSKQSLSLFLILVGSSVVLTVSYFLQSMYNRAWSHVTARFSSASRSGALRT